MKGVNNIKGISGNLFVHKIVNDLWKSDWNKFDHENDDGIDGTIHIRKKGEWTGEVIYVQIKKGNSYILESKKSPNYFGIKVSKKYIESHRNRWQVLKGAVILIFIDDNENAYWTDLKSPVNYPAENKSIILVDKRNKFGLHSKGHFRKIAGFFPEDRILRTIYLNTNDLAYFKMNMSIKNFARKFYKNWSKSSVIHRKNRILGEITINRVGWRHMSRKSRGYDRIYHSWLLLSAAKKIITEVDNFFEFRRAKLETSPNSNYKVFGFLALRAKVVFPNRQESIIQVVLRGYRLYNKETNLIEQKYWFYSVYEPRRGINIQ